MKKTYFAKLAIVSFIVVAAFAFIGTPAQAETGTIASTVSIAVPITISGDSALAFGVFTAPSSGFEIWTVSAAGVLSGGASDGVDLFNNDHFRGVFTVNGESGATVSLSVGITTTFGGTGLALSALTLAPASTGVLVSGALKVTVGGTVSINAGAVSGSPAEITLTANY